MLDAIETLSPTHAYIALLIGYFDGNEALDWAHCFAKMHSDLEANSPIFELLRINRKRKDELAKVAELLGAFLASATPEFDARSEASEKAAMDLFVLRLKQYLNGSCSPWAVCRMVQPIEQLYNFPNWLGDMYNACDWIAPTAKPVDCRHLERAIRTHLDDV